MKNRKGGVKMGDTIDAIAKQMDRLASGTGSGAPRIELAPNFGGTIVRYKRKTHRIPQDAYAMEPYLSALEALFAKIGWGNAGATGSIPSLGTFPFVSHHRSPFHS